LVFDKLHRVLQFAIHIKTCSGFIRSLCRANCLSFCEFVCIVLSARPLRLSHNKVFIILSLCFTPSVWARGLDILSAWDVSGVSWNVLLWAGLHRIKTLACEAGDPGFKSPRAR